jgi:hypothetical protein
VRNLVSLNKGRSEVGVFENLAQRKIIATKTKEAKKNCLMKIFLIALPSNIISMIKSRKLRGAGHVARTGGQAIYIKLFVGVVNKRGSLEDLAVDVRISQCTVQII